MPETEEHGGQAEAWASGPVVGFWPVPREERWRPPLPQWGWAAALFLATLVTTTIVGARLQLEFAARHAAYSNTADVFPFAWAWHHPGLLWQGLPFSLALLAILLAHEFGHFLACRYYRLDSSYPMFLPAPTLIGTMGAFIRIRMPFHDRRELFDVGAAGPLAGMMVTVPLLVYGLATSRVLTPAQVQGWHPWIEFGWPAAARWVAAGLHAGVGTARIALSPVARAAWMGLLVTMLNLIPGAQLDGGHIVYALSPRVHRVSSWTAMAVLVVLGWFYWPGWYVFAAFIALMRVRHPAVPDVGGLGWKRQALAVLLLGVFLVSFAAAPVMAL